MLINEYRIKYLFIPNKNRFKRKAEGFLVDGGKSAVGMNDLWFHLICSRPLEEGINHTAFSTIDPVQGHQGFLLAVHPSEVESEQT